MDIKLNGSVLYEDILSALGIDEIPDVDFDPGDEIRFDDVAVSDDDAIEELERNGLLPEPEEEKPTYSVPDIRDAIRYVRCGDMAMARAMFDRIFDGDDKAKFAVEEVLREPIFA